MSADAIATALAPMVKELSACKDEIWELKNSVEPLRAKVAQLQRELTEALADKAALEQEMILKGAQKAASKRAWRVAGIPKVIATMCMMCVMPNFYLSMFHPALQSFCIDINIVGWSCMLVAILSMRPMDVMAIRSIAALARVGLFQNIVFNGLPMALIATKFVSFPDGETLRWEVLTAMASLLISVVPFFAWSFPALKHQHGERMPYTPNKEVTRWATARYGSVKGKMLALSAPGVAWAIREQLAGNLMTPPRIAHMGLFVSIFWVIEREFALQFC